MTAPLRDLPSARDEPLPSSAFRRAGDGSVRRRRIAAIWALLAAFAITVYVLFALAIQAAYRAV